jgi:hypothetical protein
MVAALVVVFAAAVLLSVAGIVRAKAPAVLGDAVGIALVALVLGGVGLGWAPIGAVPLGVVLGAVFLWFAGRTGLQLMRPSPRDGGGRGDGGLDGGGLGPAVYHAVLAVLGGWVVFAASRHAASATSSPGHELGVILVDLMAAILMIFASAGWLLATFTFRGESGPKPVPGLTGVREAVVAAGLALALIAVA